MIGHQSGRDSTMVPASNDWLATHGVNQWAGPKSLPLWIADPGAAEIGDISNALATKHGLVQRPCEETVRDIVRLGEGAGGFQITGAGLTDVEENALLQSLRATNSCDSLPQ